MSTPPLATESVASSQRDPLTSAGPLPSFVGPLVAACGAALLAARVAEATGNLDGVLGALLARADVAAVVLLVAGVTVVAAPAVRRAVDGDAPPSWSRHLATWLLPLYALWLPVVVLDAVTVRPERGAGSWLATALLFRDPRGAPIPGLGIGPVVTTLALAVVLVAFGERSLRARRRRPAGELIGTLLRIAAGVAASGLAVRTVLVLGGWTEPFGAVSWLPAHLDAVGAGLAVATMRVRRPAETRRGIAVAAGAACAAFVVAAAVLPRASLFTDRLDVWLRGALYAIVAGAAVLALTGRPDAGTSRLGRTLGMTAPGLVLAAELAFVTLARQHVEAVADVAAGLRFSGPALPTWLWSAAVAAAIGVLLAAAVLVPLVRVVSGRWPARPYGLALAAVVAGGLLVRVTTWLTVAPTKTDGGDPFFYHATANLLAAGRGFPEPHNWLDSETHIASALHGPLYPVVLSFSSRLGGTTYVDHKFVSILIGTGTVLLVALVAERLAGRAAALVAGALAAVYPNLWLIDSLLFPEGLFALLTTACVLVAYRWRDRPSAWRAAGLGVLIGLAGLTRGEGLLLGLLLAAPWILRHRALAAAERWRHLVLAGASCILVLVPWTVRNLTTFDVFVPLSTNGNELIMYANCEDTYRGKWLGFWSFNCQERHRAEFGEPPGDEAQKAVYWREVGLEYARDHLDEVPKVVAARVLRQWELYRPGQTVEFATIENRDKTSTAVGLVMYYGLVAASVAGAVVLRRRRERLLPLVAQALSVTITAAYAYGTVRFRAPVEPVLCILAGVLLASWWTRRSRAAQPAGGAH